MRDHLTQELLGFPLGVGTRPPVLYPRGHDITDPSRQPRRHVLGQVSHARVAVSDDLATIGRQVALDQFQQR